MVSLQRSGPRGICETVPTDRSPWAERASSLCFSGCSNQQLRPLGNLSSAEPLPSSICRGHGQMVWPEGGVKVGPEAAVPLRRDDLPVGWPPPVDLLAEQRGGIERVRPKFDLFRAVARDELPAVDLLLKRRSVAKNSHQAERQRNNIVGEGREPLRILKPKQSLGAEPAVEHVEQELGPLVKDDLPAVVNARVVEGRKLSHQPLEYALAPVVEPARPLPQKRVELALVFRRQPGAHFAKDSDPLVEHRHLNVAAKNFFQILAADPTKKIALQDRLGLIERV